MVKVDNRFLFVVLCPNKRDGEREREREKERERERERK